MRKRVMFAVISGLPLAALAQDVAVADGQTLLEAVTVVGTPNEARQVQGAVTVIDQVELELGRVFTTAEALRKAPGVNVRDEEGFGLRPNIGIRGLNPTRSTKALLLEDGIPLAYAPYGDNASYYHPPVDRFDRIEILKGPAINAYGPQTISGVINYLTPTPPQERSGGLMLAGGSRGYINAHGWLGGDGLLFDVVRKEGEGARDNIESELNDLNFKGVRSFGAHTLIARANFYSEDSQVTYSGLTDAELANFGYRYNPFKNDEFEAERFGASLSDEWALGQAKLVTNLYYNRYSRDWWRQASTTTDGQCDSSYETATGRKLTDDRRNGLAVNPDLCQSAQGRLRNYYTLGLEPRLSLPWGANELTVSLRAHVESQDRVQLNGAAATARSGTVAESNKRETDAYSLFAQNRFVIGALAITPGLRLENVSYERHNRINDTSADADLTEVLPSLGLNYELSPQLMLFGGVHKGFAPPRTEDILSQSSSGVTAVDLDAEESTNLELGFRSTPQAGLNIEAALFRNDFKRQIAVGSIAGGSTPLAAGEALYQGMEAAVRAEFGRLLDLAHNPFLQLSYTVLATARSETPFLKVSDGQPVTGSAAGKRLPYAPHTLLTATLGYSHPVGVDLRLEAQHIGQQFSDFGNTVDAPAGGNGQIGEIASVTVWNLAANYRSPLLGLGVFASAKNLFDKDYIVDRTRGIQTGASRLVEAGIEYKF